MRAQVQSNPDDIDITSLWSVLKRSGPKIILYSGLIGALTYMGLSLVAPKYKSEAVIQIGTQGDKSSPNAVPDVISVKQDREAVVSQVAVLKSRDLAIKLAADLKLASRPEFNAALGGQDFVGGLLRIVGLSGPRPGESDEERVFNAYQKALKVFQTKDSRVITIEFQSNDSELAARAANRLVELHQESLRSQVVSTTVETNDFLKPQIEKLSREVAEVEAAVENFRRQSDQFRGAGTAGAGSLNEQQLTELTTEVTKARTARTEIEARARSARELLQRSMADAIPDVQKSPVIQGLIAQRVRAEREKAEAETQLLSGHPRMKQLNANVTDLRRQVNREAIVIVEGLEKEAKVLALREELATKSLDETKSRIGSKSVDIAKLASLEGSAKSKRKELETLQARYEEGRNKVDIRSAPLEAQIVQKAYPSGIPNSPKKPQLAGLAAAASLILGFVVVVTRELLGGARRGGQAQPAQAPVHTPAPVAPATLATAIPVARTQAATQRTQAQTAPVASAAVPTARASESAQPAAGSSFVTLASAETVARRIAGNGEGQGGYRTVVVGDAEGLDVGGEAVDIAASLNAAGKQVVLVDWSANGVGMSKELGVDPGPGFLDLIEGRATFEDVIRRLPDGEVHVVPCGKAQAATVGRIDADRINLVLDALDEAYDHIVVCGTNSAISELFLAIQGRFDAGVLVCDSRQRAAATDAAPGTFLGYQVTDIDVVRFDRAGQGAGRKMQLARNTERPETRV